MLFLRMLELGIWWFFRIGDRLDFLMARLNMGVMNTSLISLSAQQLRRAAALKERIEALNHELNRLLGAPAGDGAVTVTRRKVSRAGIARIRAAAKARWARIKAAAKATRPAKRKRKLSASAKAKLAAIARERWRKVKAAGKSKL